jgi:hypothetical protein
MKKILVTLTDELIEAIDHARKGTRSESVERWLWRIAEIRESAAKLDLEIRPARTPMGRPPKEDR